MPQTKEERKEAQKIANRKYRDTHKGEIAERKRVRYQANKQSINMKRSIYVKANRGKVNWWNKKAEVNLRKQIVDGYGGKCACCGETQPIFLEIDHIDNDGRTDREKFNSFREFYRWLRNNGFPKDKYQLLCSNCNQGKRRNGGVCPHRVVV